MAIIALIGGTLAAGSGLLALMTWLESSLQKDLAPDEAPRPKPVPSRTDVAPPRRPSTIAA